MLNSRHLLRCAWLTAASLLPLIGTTLPVAARKKAAPAPPPPAPIIAGAAGLFQDRDGGKHAWQVNPAFALQWEGSPYLPVGVAFTPRSLSEPENSAAWDADQAALRAWKQAGITDIYIQPENSSAAPAVPAWQRLLDFLEAEGFHYGLGIPAKQPDTATGYYVRSGTFLIGPVRSSGDYSLDLQFPNLPQAKVSRAACAILDQAGRLKRLDWAKLETNGTGTRATLHVDVPTGEIYTVALTPLVTNAVGLPDYWNGFGDTRDSVLPLAQLKYGKGLRFFSLPLSATLRLDGADGYIIPNSDAYRVEFEAFLTRKYHTIEALRGQWAFLGDLPDSIQTAARMIPLTVAKHQGQLVGYLLDEKESRCYVVDLSASSFWYDHLYFREDSLRDQQNQLAQLLREQLADVPVVLPRAGDLRYYHINDRKVGGFAGIGVQVNALRMLHEAGLGIAEARLSTLRPWYVALGLEGYQTKDSLLGSLETLRRLGAKGWFITPPADAPATSALWLAEYRAQLTATAGAAEYLPRYILFPHSIRETGGFGVQHPKMDVDTQQLAPDAWWIPTLAAWHSLNMGDTLRAYSLPGAVGDEIYLWSPGGKQRVSFRPEVYGTVEAHDISGKLLAKHEGKGIMRLDVGEAPVIITGLSSYQLAPIEVAKNELAEMERLVKEVGATNNDVRDFQQIVSLARSVGPEKHPLEVRDLLRQPLEKLRSMAVSGESAVPAAAPTDTPTK